MKSLLILFSLLFSTITLAHSLEGGVTVLDGDNNVIVVGEFDLLDKWSLQAGSGGKIDYLGITRIISLDEIRITFGFGYADGPRISEGPNFIIGIHYDWGSMRVSARHLSNGAQTFGHDRYPNSGENFITLGYRW